MRYLYKFSGDLITESDLPSPPAPLEIPKLNRNRQSMLIENLPFRVKTGKDRQKNDPRRIVSTSFFDLVSTDPDHTGFIKRHSHDPTSSATLAPPRKLFSPPSNGESVAEEDQDTDDTTNIRDSAYVIDYYKKNSPFDNVSDSSSMYSDTSLFSSIQNGSLEDFKPKPIRRYSNSEINEFEKFKFETLKEKELPEVPAAKLANYDDLRDSLTNEEYNTQMDTAIFTRKQRTIYLKPSPPPKRPVQHCVINNRVFSL